LMYFERGIVTEAVTWGKIEKVLPCGFLENDRVTFARMH
jgi:hypothetical protein